MKKCFSVLSFKVVDILAVLEKPLPPWDFMVVWAASRERARRIAGSIFIVLSIGVEGLVQVNGENVVAVRGEGEDHGYFTICNVIPHLPQPQMLSRCLISGKVSYI